MSTTVGKAAVHLRAIHKGCLQKYVVLTWYTLLPFLSAFGYIFRLIASVSPQLHIFKPVIHIHVSKQYANQACHKCSHLSLAAGAHEM